MASWPHVTEVKVLRAKVLSVPAKLGQSGSVRVNPRPRPGDCPCHGPGAPLEQLCLCACALLRGRVGLRNGGVHVLRPAVGRGRPAEPPAADHAASRRPGKSALFALVSGVGGHGVGTRPGCGALRGAGTAGMFAVLRGCGPGLRAGARAARLCSGPRPQEAGQDVLAVGLLCGSLRSAPRGDWGRPCGGPTLPGPFWGRGMPFKCTFRSREPSLVGRTSEHQQSRPACLPQIVVF